MAIPSVGSTPDIRVLGLIVRNHIIDGVAQIHDDLVITANGLGNVRTSPALVAVEVGTLYLYSVVVRNREALRSHLDLTGVIQSLCICCVVIYAAPSIRIQSTQLFISIVEVILIGLERTIAIRILLQY